MTTTRLYSNGQLFMSAYKNGLEKIRGISVIYLVFSVLLFPVMFFFEINRFTKYLETGSYRLPDLIGSARIYPMPTVLFYFVLMVISAVLMSIVVNKYMLDKKEVDVYHSLPIKRETMLLGNFAAVATAVLVPMLICYVTVMFENMVLKNVVENADLSVLSSFDMPAVTRVFENFVESMASPGQVMLEFLIAAMMILAIIAVTFLACVCACSVFDAVAFTISLLEVVPLFTILISLVFSSFVNGFVMPVNLMYYGGLASPVNTLIMRMCAVELFGFGNYKITGYVNNMIIVWSVLAVVILALTIFIYKKRKSESAQNYDISGAMYRIIIALAVFGMAVISGFMTSAVAFNDGDTYWSAVFAVIYGVLYFFIMQSIFTRSVRFQIKRPILMAICAFAAPIFMVCVLTGWFGYETYVPELEDIKSVSTNYNGRYERVRKYVRDDETRSRTVDVYPVFTETGSMEALRSIHQDIVAVNDAGEYSGTLSDNDLYWLNIRIEYELKNGRKVTRSYDSAVHKDSMLKLASLNDSEEFKRQLSPVLADSENLPAKINFYSAFGKKIDTDSKDITKEKMQKIYDALALDIIAETMEDAADNKGKIYGTIYFYHNDNGTQYNENAYVITNNYVNTIDALKKIGFDEEDFSAVPENLKMVVSGISGDGEILYAPNARGFSSMDYLPDIDMSAGITDEIIHTLDDYGMSYYTTDEEEIREFLSRATTWCEPFAERYTISVGNSTFWQTYFVSMDDVPEEFLNRMTEIDEIRIKNNEAEEKRQQEMAAKG